jgi:hypothetical protein
MSTSCSGRCLPLQDVVVIAWRVPVGLAQTWGVGEGCGMRAMKAVYTTL